MYKEISKSNHERESEILNSWKEMDLLKKTIENRNGKEEYVFYDGPIYANAKPGIHHVFAKTIKDAFCKYQTMQGKRVLRKIGLDTHGLPIEVNVEKKLGFKTKADIENFGIENFCKECNKETATNIDEVNKVTDMMGQLIDCDNPYITCSNDYIESEWWLIKNIFDKGLIYHGNKVLPYCPRCGTELSQNEVSQGYQEDTVNTVIVPFKLVNEDVYVLVWTTTPWTLMDNVALCVNPDYKYLLVKSMGYKFIVGESLANKVLGDEYEVLETYKGSELVGKKYEQIMPFVAVEGNSFQILADNYVTDADGTGIVHIAPAYGEDDNRVCRENNIGFVQSVGKDGCYTTGPWKGTLVTDKDLEIEIIKYLKENDKLFKKIKLTHDYPHCWRCKSPLIYYAKPAWYIRTTEYKDKILEANRSVNWYPEFVGEKRFNNWLENMIDWGISRNRYWGCPMPLWTCDCGHVECIGSRQELQDKLIEDVNVFDIELHRPYVDDLHIKCPKCGKTMNRVPDVMDVWFDSGAMPYAQWHYPFENKELFESHFPADFIAEGVDQTRGWFNSLICISTIVSGVSSFKNVVVNDMMLDAKGKKMSKSTGNIINPEEIMTQYGADPVRYYMLSASPVWTPLKFDLEGVKEVNSKVFSTLKNTYNFFAMYANADKLDTKDFINNTDYEEIDRWLLSKYNKLVKEVTLAYDEYDLNRVVKPITQFLNEDLSNWYIRRNRRRFWKGELDSSKLSVYKVTYDVLVGVSKLIAPVSPYMSEEIYRNLTNEESVHLSNFPKCDESLIDETIETKMDLVRDLISLGRNAREEANVKIRQPLSKVYLDKNIESITKDLVDLIKEELNVKEVEYITDKSKYLSYQVKPNFKEVGKLFGKNIGEFTKFVSELSDSDLNNLENIKFNSDGVEYALTNDMLDIRIVQKEGYDAKSDGVNFVILDVNITEELRNEGILRDIIRQCQLFRKEAGFNVEDRINIKFESNNTELLNMLNNNKDIISSELLAKFDEVDSYEFSKDIVDDYTLNVKMNRI